MDRKSIIVLIVSAILMVSWFKISERLFPPIPIPETAETSTNAAETNLSGTTTSISASTNASTGSATATAAANSASGVKTDPETAFVAAKGTEETLVLETNNVRYIFTSNGGGLKQVELTDYPETVGNGKAIPGPKRFATLNTKAPVPVLALLGVGGLQDDSPFKLTRTEKGVRAEKSLPNGVLLVKEFTPASNYLVNATVRLENRSGQPVAIKDQEWVIGTATPMSPTDPATAVAFQWYNGEKVTEINQSWFANRFMGCMQSRPRDAYDGGEGNVAWSGVFNQFFALAVIPKSPAQHVVSRNIKLPAPSESEIEADKRTVREPHGFQTALVYPGTLLGTAATNNFIQREFTLYAGPKKYGLLATLAAQFNNNLDLLMGFDTGFGGRFSGFFAKALLLSMNGLHNFFNLSYALCIIAITIIVKLVFWPLTLASTRSMKRMQELQPQMKAIQEKYKDDPAKSQQKLMEFMKENKVSPLGGCLPMLLQFPVFIGFFTMIRSAIELRGASFLWAHDLSQADTIFTVAGFPINPLPMMMAATMLWQSSMTPPSPGMDPSQQKIMKYMPLMMVVFLYNFSGGLTLYYTVQNLLSIAQTKLTKTKDAKDKAAAAGKVEPPAKKKK